MSTVPITPLVSENSPWGWFGLERFAHLGQPLPRFAPPNARVAVTIPSTAEKKQAVEIVSGFAEAENVFWAHNSAPIKREIETNAIQS